MPNPERLAGVNGAAVAGNIVLADSGKRLPKPGTDCIAAWPIEFSRWAGRAMERIANR